MKPILYLDVDDTLLGYPGGKVGAGVPEFIRWATAHFEVRWLTMWCPSGDMRLPADGAAHWILARRLKITDDEVLAIINPHPFPVWGFRVHGSYRDKSESIRAMLAEMPDREWVWVEDPHLEYAERDFLAAPENAQNYYETSTSHDPLAVLKTWAALAERFQLPAPDLVR